MGADDAPAAELLEEMTRNDKGVKFHGLLNREQNAALLSKSKVGMNPHELSAVPGNVFAFKIVEYLAAGNHVITTPMGALEADLEAGITYIPNNTPELIAKALREVLQERLYEKTAADASAPIPTPSSRVVVLGGVSQGFSRRGIERRGGTREGTGDVP